MADTNRYRRAIVWAQVEKDGMSGARLVRATQKRPRDPLGGCVLVRLVVDIPAAAFEPWEVSVTVPDGAYVPARAEASEMEDPS